MLNHDDKDSEIWLKSKGTLSVDNQQFWHWLRASQFSPSRRQRIEVKGYDSETIQTRSVRASGLDRALIFGRSRKGRTDRRWSEISNTEVKAGVGGGQKILVSKLEKSMIVGNSNLTHPISDFMAVIEEIDKALNDDQPISNPSGVRDQDIEKQILNLEKRRGVALITGEGTNLETERKILMGKWI